MATFYLKLSRRIQKETQMGELIIRLRNGNDYDILVKSGLFITPDNFKNGELVVNRRKVGNDIKYHEDVERKLNGLKSYIQLKLNETDKKQITKVWLSDLIDRYLHPEKYQLQDDAKDLTLYTLAETYLTQKQFSYDHTKGFRVLVRAVARYEGFRRYEASSVVERRNLSEVLADDEKFKFDPETVTRDDIEDFRDYLRNEKELSSKYNRLFKVMLENYPANIKSGYHEIEGRGDNAIIKLMKKLKAFFGWLYDTGRITNKPFDGIKIGSEKYGKPYYLTKEERNKIEQTKMPTAHLEVQRDIFVFHCFVGCRVSDLRKLTERNIVNGVLSYTPHKTKDDGTTSVVAKVPLHPKAMELINKYRGKDKQGRLFPFISDQKYNDAIKQIFTIAGITRNVEVRNALTGEMEIRPINELASSHIARRTFVGIAYKQVADPNIIGKMSGHVEGSKAFVRYRDIDDDMLKDVINKIG